MWKVFFLLMFIISGSASADVSSLNKAKYIATLKVIVNHKMSDEDMTSDFNKLREDERFKKELKKMVNKLDNSKPNDLTNRKIMKILEQAGKDIYNELR